MVDQVAKGVEVIRAAAMAALIDRGVANAEVSCLADSEPKPGAALTISVNGKVETQIFTYDELEDSGEAIDAPAAVKMRMLVSKFVG